MTRKIAKGSTPAESNRSFSDRGMLGPLDSAIYDGRYNIGYWFWEMSAFPRQWRSCFDVYDEIWVSSSFTQATLSVLSPIPVVPPGPEPTKEKGRCGGRNRGHPRQGLDNQE